MRRRLGLVPGAGDAAVAVELELGLGALDPQRAPREAPLAHPGCQPVGELEGGRDLGLGVAPLRLRVGQPRAAPDDRAVEARLTGRRQLDGDAQPILVRPEAAAIVCELRRQHRRGAARHVGREGPARRAAVERRPRGDEGGHVGDVHPGADAALLLADGDRVVEVFCGLGIDREGEEIAQVDPPG